MPKQRAVTPQGSRIPEIGKTISVAIVILGCLFQTTAENIPSNKDVVTSKDAASPAVVDNQCTFASFLETGAATAAPAAAAAARNVEGSSFLQGSSLAAAGVVASTVPSMAAGYAVMKSYDANPLRPPPHVQPNHVRPPPPGHMGFQPAAGRNAAPAFRPPHHGGTPARAPQQFRSATYWQKPLNPVGRTRRGRGGGRRHRGGGRRHRNNKPRPPKSSAVQELPSSVGEAAPPPTPQQLQQPQLTPEQQEQQRLLAEQAAVLQQQQQQQALLQQQQFQQQQQQQPVTLQPPAATPNVNSIFANLSMDAQNVDSIAFDDMENDSGNLFHENDPNFVVDFKGHCEHKDLVRLLGFVKVALDAHKRTISLQYKIKFDAEQRKRMQWNNDFPTLP